MLQPLRNYLRRELERPALDLALGVGFGDIRDTAMRVRRELVDQGVRRCDIVGYSMLQFAVHVPLVLFLVWALNYTLTYSAPILP